MRRDPDFFGDQEMVLVYIAKKLNDALALENLLTERSRDYLVEVDTYTGGIIFRGARAGAFFYVPEAQADQTRRIMRENGYRFP